MKKISILTCVIGEPDSLVNTYNSIFNSLCEDVTWTLKFHQSTDSTFIKKIENKYVNIFKQSDTGLYDAMNQGLELMNEDYYFILGSGDELNGSSFQNVLELLKGDNFGSSIYFFPVKYLNSNLVLQPLPEKFPVMMACPHPGTIFNRKMSLEIGGYDTKYRITSDYDHVSRYVNKFGSGKKGGEILVSILAGGMSEQKALEAYLEEELIRKRVWHSVDWAVYNRMLQKSTTNISHFLNQVLDSAV